MRISDWSSDVCSSDLFHKNIGEHSHIEEGWTHANQGRYIFVGNRAAPDGTSTSGIYSVEASMHAMQEFTPADEHYIAAFEKRYAGQVNRLRQAQADEAGSGLSFGQIIALVLGAAVLRQADISWA